MKKQQNIEELLKKIFTSIIILIVITGINSFILLFNNPKSSKPDVETQEHAQDYDVSQLTEIKANEINKNTKGRNTIIYIGRDTCGWCVEFTGVLNEAIDKHDLGEVLYIDIAKIIDFTQNKVIDQESYDFMMNLKTVKSHEKYMEENFGATPMILIVKDGQLVEAQTGYSEIEAFSNFLKENGFE